MIWLFVIFGIIVLLAIAVMVSVAPGKIPPEAATTAKLFYGLNCAHRGLYTKDQKIPENSRAAFVAAREKGYGVELDVHLTTDERVVVFHDYNLKRTCGVDKSIFDMSYIEMSKYRLFGTDEKILLLTEALDILGDTPVIVELKPSGKKNARLCSKVLEILHSHGKNYCIESFDPRICGWFKRNAPNILRGQLSCPPREYVGISKASSVIIGNLLLNFIARPHFIAYKNKPYPPIVKLCMSMGPMIAIWTIVPDHDISKVESSNDIVIFEHYTPAPRFK